MIFHVRGREPGGVGPAQVFGRRLPLPVGATARGVETDRRARTYHRWQFRLAAVGCVLTACYLLALIVTGATVDDHPTAFIRAMERLGTLNLAERDPHFLKELLLHSHPSLGRRVARARDLLRPSG